MKKRVSEQKNFLKTLRLLGMNFKTCLGFIILIIPLLLACGNEKSGKKSKDMCTVSYNANDCNMSASDFECILNWNEVGSFRITNKLGRLEEALAVANSPTGGTYPPGTIIQVIPIEAMVKRDSSWNPATNNWEFFTLELSASETKILSRGTTDIATQFGGRNCVECHSKADSQFDFICTDNHGCDPLPDIFTSLIEPLQNGDTRCQ